jgi:predicted oxidoreductase
MQVFCRVATLLTALAATATAGPPPAKVKQCQLGALGPNVSCIVYGTLHMHEAGTCAGPRGSCPTQTAAALAMIERALGAGITTFDLASNYNDMPQLFGAAVRSKPGLREKIQVIAKMDCAGGNKEFGFGFDSGATYDTSLEYMEKNLQTYLDSLNTTYVDVLMLHRQDYIMEVDEIATYFAKLNQEGKARYFGASNFDRPSFELLASRLQEHGIPLIANEIEISPITPAAIHDGTVAYHYSTKTGILAWSAVGGDPWGHQNRLFMVGSLDGTPHNARIHAGLGDVAKNLSTAANPVGQDVVALAWLLRHPAQIIPIIGTMNPTRLMQQAAAGAVAEQMTADMWYHIADAVGVPIP